MLNYQPTSSAGFRKFVMCTVTFCRTGSKIEGRCLTLHWSPRTRVDDSTRLQNPDDDRLVGLPPSGNVTCLVWSLVPKNDDCSLPSKHELSTLHVECRVDGSTLKVPVACPRLVAGRFWSGLSPPRKLEPTALNGRTFDSARVGGSRS